MCVRVHILVCMSACVYVAKRDCGNIFSLYINKSRTAQYVEILCDQLSLHAADYIATDSVNLYILPLIYYKCMAVYVNHMQLPLQIINSHSYS